MFDAKPDCRHFLGEKPCQPGKECPECDDYSPMGTRILIIKMGAGGDVLRTASLLPGLKEKYLVSHITWVTEKQFFPLLVNNHQLDRLLSLDINTLLPLLTERFDIAICLDKVPEATSLIEQVNAGSKFGFGMDHNGSLRPINKLAEYGYHLGLSDQLKFTQNTKTYPELIYEMCGLAYSGQRYEITLNEEQTSYAEHIVERSDPERLYRIGLNTGSGPVFATKKWNLDHWLELTRLLHNQLPVSLFLLGGPDERKRNGIMLERCRVPLNDTGTDNSLTEFIAIIASLDMIITSDTLALHIALALGKKVIVLMGPTSATEIDVFGFGCKIVSGFDCSPCYRKDCDLEPNCMDSIAPKTVSEAVEKLFHLS